MRKHNILLSSGTFPWLSPQRIIILAKQTGFDGIELLPTRAMVKDTPISSFIKSIHQNWRLDIGLDKAYGIYGIKRLFYTAVRYVFFPSPKLSRAYIASLSKNFQIPVTVHDIKNHWTADKENKEFSGGLHLEIVGDNIKSIKQVKTWLNNTKHSMVVDTRDDQLLVWAKKQGFKNWKTFYESLGLKKIKNIQLTLIGKKGIKNILKKNPTLAEKQLLWFHKKHWTGSVTIEVNPLMLFIETKGNIAQGLNSITTFVRETLDEGKRWSRHSGKRSASRIRSWTSQDDDSI